MNAATIERLENALLAVYTEAKERHEAMARRLDAQEARQRRYDREYKIAIDNRFRLIHQILDSASSEEERENLKDIATDEAIKTFPLPKF